MAPLDFRCKFCGDTFFLDEGKHVRLFARMQRSLNSRKTI